MNFLQQIKENPQDDNLKLAYADYLEEQGDPQGELIRIQIELMKNNDFPPYLNDDKTAYVYYKEKTITLQKREQQLVAIVKTNLNLKQVMFHKGLPAFLTIQTIDDLIGFENNPTIIGLSFKLPKKDVKPALAKIKTLKTLYLTNYYFTDFSFENIVHSINKIKLNYLSVEDNDIKDHGIRLLNIENLKYLNINNNFIQDVNSLIKEFKNTTIIIKNQWNEPDF